MRRTIGPRLAAGLALCAALPASASILYVRAGATGAANGSSWADAYPDLRLALAAANPGDQIWVTRGTYRPATPGGSRESSFALRTGVALYGGFAGNESTLEQRDIGANPAILSGDLNGNDGPAFANMQDNAYHVVVALGVDETAILDGFTVRAGRADGPGSGPTPESKDQGAALNIYAAMPLIENCTFEGNWSANHGAVNDHGGATILSCVFRANYAGDHGAGLYIHHDVRSTVRTCLFDSNVTPGDGAGVYSASMVQATLEDSAFMDNRANRGAGVFIAHDGTLAMTNCGFTTNIADLGGGGVFCDFALPEILGCVFTANRAGVAITGGGGGGGGSGGGGLWFSGGWASVFDCGFYDNEASFGGGVYHNEGCQGSIYGCVFEGNSASEAGGLYALSSPVLVEGCLFRNNAAFSGSFPVGGGMSTYFSNTVTRGCTFAGNTAQLGGGGMYCEGEAPVILRCRFIGNSSLGSPAIQQGWGGGVMNGFNAATTIRDSAFVGNHARQCAGIFNIFLSHALIAGCSLTANTADDQGGGIYTYPGTLAAAVNTVVWGNAPQEIAGDPVAISYSCIAGGYPGPGVIASDPLFTRLPSPGPDNRWGTWDDDPGDLTPGPGSACIDAGDSRAVPATATIDLAFNPRRHDDAGTPDTAPGGAPAVDLGAYEFQGTTCYPNCDASTTPPVLNVSDFVCFSQRFAAGDGRANCDGSTAPPTLNVGDFICFMQRFAAGCP